MNALVMDFLVSKGYPGTAERFAKEANVPMNTDADTINERVEVRDLIYKEEIITAIEKINDIDPQVRTRLQRAVPLHHPEYVAMMILVHAPLIINFRF